MQHRVPGYAGVIDQDIDGPDILDDLGDALLARGVVAHIELIDGNAVLGLERVGGCVVAGVVRGHAVALVR